MTIAVMPPIENKENSGVLTQEVWPSGNAVFCAEVASTEIVIRRVLQ